MANLKEIRSRIASVSSTMQITSAMKMVSAAKLKKHKTAITAMRPYADTLTELLQNSVVQIEDASGSVFATERPVEKYFWLRLPPIVDSVEGLILASSKR
ncbi:MAG: hypothetical protein CM15mP83_0590 [Flavobacteriaceae bacterium]|nr:MAG: hypothetical protein CM15mP83_0590 [Flavobacteriaceae bacterium]